MPTKNTHRKVLAVALGVVGVAGLSLASASTLNVSGSSSNIQAGVDTVGACQGTGTVAASFGSPTLSSGAYKTTNVTLSGIVAACAGKSLKVAFVDSSGATVESSALTLPAATGATLGAQTVTVGSGLDSAALAKVAVTIYG
jgi:hypothetical protein